MADAKITAEQAREIVSYCSETGVFRWLEHRGSNARMGEIAGSETPKGYRQICISGRSYLLHRLAWLVVHGRWPEGEIDHINGVRHDNRIENLRDVTRSANLQNQKKPHKDNRQSGSLGVSWDRERSKWRAQITVGGKTIRIGRFASEAAAFEAYVLAKARMHEGYVAA
jgi:hypothetical protein